MQQAQGGLKDIFNTILSDKGKKTRTMSPAIVVHGNGNVIAPGGTVHVVQGAPGDSGWPPLQTKER